MSSMFCYQCEQTAGGTGCTKFGVCGKAPSTAALQDALLHVTKGIGALMHHAAAKGVRDRAIDRFVVEALFTTVTNVNFDDDRLATLVRKAFGVRDEARALLAKADAAAVPASTPANFFGWQASGNPEQIAHAAEVFSIDRRRAELGDDAVGLQELITYGLKGMAAYADHAMILGKEDDSLYAFFHEALEGLTRPPQVDALVALSLKCGEVNLKIMELLDSANTGAYGHPVPTAVRVTPVKGKAILVSGHDLKDLDYLLQQTEGKGINIYTHGEMLPCHGYPGLKKYPHLVGNYGGAWQDQQKEFDEFPGAILMTTNCIQRPRPSYMERIFTCGLVAWPGVEHISDRDFSPVIEAALAAPGFAEDAPEHTILVGFGHNAVLGVAPTVIEAVKAGKLRHFFLIGGCDGAKSGRNYYTEFAEQVPQDCVILTLACGKYRFNKLEFGDIGGIPRLLDCGQCNDAYSAIKIAAALAEAFETDVNGLPLSMILSWYEQKAVCILLTLLHLGIKNMRLGPTLPAFVGPNVLKVLVEKFNLMPITTPEKDLAAMLG